MNIADYAPQPDLEAYNRNLEIRLKFSQLFAENFTAYQSPKELSENVLHYPIKADVEIAAQCNLRCPMCDITKQAKPKRSENMTYKSFQDVVDSLHSLLELRIAGLGEPLLNKDVIKMVRYARSKHIWVRLVTNGTLLARKANYKALIDADICELIVSIDGTDKETFEALRVKAKFEEVVANCQMLNEYGLSQGFSKRIKMWTTLQKRNAHQLCDFPRFASTLGFRKMGVSLALHRWGAERWQNYLDENTYTVDEVTLKNLIKEARSNEIELGIEHVSRKYDLKSPCKWPFDRIHIAADQRIVPCCMVSNPDTYSLGKLTRLEDVWNAKPYQELRRGHITGQLPSICVSCYGDKSVPITFMR